jgi:hypothetical protein
MILIKGNVFNKGHDVPNMWLYQVHISCKQNENLKIALNVGFINEFSDIA